MTYLGSHIDFIQKYNMRVRGGGCGSCDLDGLSWLDGTSHQKGCVMGMVPRLAGVPHRGFHSWSEGNMQGDMAQR